MSRFDRVRKWRVALAFAFAFAFGAQALAGQVQKLRVVRRGSQVSVEQYSVARGRMGSKQATVDWTGGSICGADVRAATGQKEIHSDGQQVVTGHEGVGIVRSLGQAV